MSPAGSLPAGQMKTDNGLLLPILQPAIAGNPAVVLVHRAVAFPPVAELAGGDVEPPMNRPAPNSVFSDQRRMKSTIWSRVSCGTVCHTAPRSAPAPADASSGWQLSLPACSPSVASSGVRSIILTGGTLSPFPAEPEQGRRQLVDPKSPVSCILPPVFCLLLP